MANAIVSPVTGRGDFTTSCMGTEKEYTYASRLKAKRQRIKLIKALKKHGFKVSKV